MPIQSLQGQHALAHMALPRLVPPPHTLETLHGPTGSYDLAQLLLHPCVGRRPLGPQTRPQGLLQGHKLRQADAFFPRGVPHRLPQGPHTSAALTPQGGLNGLGPVGRPPSEIRQRPLIPASTPSLAPRWTCQRLGSLLPLCLRPRPLVPLPVGPKDRQRHGHPAHDACRLHRLLKGPLGLTPRGPRMLRPAAGIMAPLFALRDFVVALWGGLSLPLRPLPLAMHDALEVALGMQHVEPHLEGH